MSDRTKLLSLLCHLDQIDAASNQLLALDSGETIDCLAEHLSLLTQSMSKKVNELLQSPAIPANNPQNRLAH
jgi:hypothetical protein